MVGIVEKLINLYITIKMYVYLNKKVWVSFTISKNSYYYYKKELKKIIGINVFI